MHHFDEPSQSSLHREQLIDDMMVLERCNGQTDEPPSGMMVSGLLKVESSLHNTLYLIQATAHVSEIPNGSSGIAVSTAFGSSSNHGDGSPDLTLVSSDDVHFFVRRSRLLKASNSSFDHQLSTELDAAQQPSIHLPEDANTLNIIIHTIYSIPFHHYNPTLGILLEVTEALKKYGISLQLCLSPGTPLFKDFAHKSPYMPLEVYTVAAQNDLFGLACEASKHMLAFPLGTLSDDVIQKMGPIYLRLLFTMQMERLFVLKRLVASPPAAHVPTDGCGAQNYEEMKSAWLLASVDFIMGASPGSSC